VKRIPGGSAVNVRNQIVALSSLLMSSSALAGPGLPLPEPETLALLAIGGAAIVIARWGTRK